MSHHGSQMTTEAIVKINIEAIFQKSQEMIMKERCWVSSLFSSFYFIWFFSGTFLHKISDNCNSYDVLDFSLTLFNPEGGGQICPHPAQTRIPVKNQWVEILMIFFMSSTLETTFND